MPQQQHQAPSLAAVPLPAAFAARKRRILAALAVPAAEYTDRSPKGAVDAGVRGLLGALNGAAGFVTTSSCAGRVCVFLEGRRRRRRQEEQEQEQGQGQGQGHTAAGGGGGGEEEENEEAETKEAAATAAAAADRGRGVRGTVAGVGGKGGGGRWLFVSHEPVQMSGRLGSEPNVVAALLGMEEPIFSGVEGGAALAGEVRLIHFKFEPMILHVLTASPHHAQLLLRCGLQAGFRESGAINLLAPPAAADSPAAAAAAAAATPMVAIRCMGLGLESLIGTETNGIKHCTVSEEYLWALVTIANERFVENARRIARFQGLFEAAVAKEVEEAREDARLRKERNRAEGLRKAQEVKVSRENMEGEVPWGMEEVGVEELMRL